jgi:hypothetical protein
MLAVGGFISGAICTYGYGYGGELWPVSDAENITVEYDLKYGVAYFQVSRYNMTVTAMRQCSMTITMKYT